MPLRLIHIQHLPGFLCQCMVDHLQPFCYIFMYRAFTDTKLPCSLSYCCIVLYDIICGFNDPLLDIIFQKYPPANIVFTMYAEGLRSIPQLMYCFWKIFFSMPHQTLKLWYVLQMFYFLSCTTPLLS